MDRERVIDMVNKMTGGYTRRDEISMDYVTLNIDTSIENGVAGIRMATSITVVNTKNDRVLINQSFEKMIPIEDFKYLNIPYVITEDGIVFEYNNHTVKYGERGESLVIEERDTRTDIVTSIITIGI